MTSPGGAIVPILITINERSGLTLWAPPWEDDEGEEWQGFLGDGAKIIMFPGVDELAEFIATSDENDLSDHPGWAAVTKYTPAQLRPVDDNRYDLDMVYEWAADDPTPVTESSLADVVEMALRIAEACEDGALRRLIGSTPEYAELINGEDSYTGREGAKAWSALGDTIASTWERALRRVEQWLDWRGDFEGDDSDELEAESLWDRVTARPIELVFSDDDIVLTMRAVIDDEAVFLGNDGDLIVFIEPEDLAAYCREAEEHELVKLEWWEEVRDAEDEVFIPNEDDSYDLTEPTSRTAELLRELAEFCELDYDAGFLDEPKIDRDAWDALVAELLTCLDRED
ncbi:MAG: hypothetical protein JWM76_4751 [Pseudonocardiales bacterium]|nr:hypothetical protein [Pseudonocardiales bacterium]